MSESERLVAGLVRGDGSVVVPPRLASWLVGTAVRDLDAMRRLGRGGGVRQDVIELLTALQVSAIRAESEGGSASGTAGQVSNRLEVQPSGFMTVSEVADVRGSSPRAIRKAIADGRLKASKRGRDWWIDAQEVERFRFEGKNDDERRGRRSGTCSG